MFAQTKDIAPITMFGLSEKKYECKLIKATKVLLMAHLDHP